MKDTIASRCATIRLGHAFYTHKTAPDSDNLIAVLAILRGASSLTARTPSDPEAVSAAERIFGLSESPIYFFVGCLHSSLGKIGLILRPGAAEGRLQGATRCDSGGLAGRRGAFVALPELDVREGLLALSFEGDSREWHDAFIAEVHTSYADVVDYVNGAAPDYSDWGDPRSTCIAHAIATADVDRRLWTWELRLNSPPSSNDYEALVLSTETFKQLEILRMAGEEIPDHIRVLHGRDQPNGVSFFSHADVVRLLCGTLAP